MGKEPSTRTAYYQPYLDLSHLDLAPAFSSSVFYRGTAAPVLLLGLRGETDHDSFKNPRRESCKETPATCYNSLKCCKLLLPPNPDAIEIEPSHPLLVTRVCFFRAARVQKPKFRAGHVAAQPGRLLVEAALGRHPPRSQILSQPPKLC